MPVETNWPRSLQGKTREFGHKVRPLNVSLSTDTAPRDGKCSVPDGSRPCSPATRIRSRCRARRDDNNIGSDTHAPAPHSSEAHGSCSNGLPFGCTHDRQPAAKGGTRRKHEIAGFGGL